jgi:hypothetical protein
MPPLYRVDSRPELDAPVIVAAFDGWVDAGGAATAAVERLSDGGLRVATFDSDALYDYRARRPTLDIVDGRLARLDWPETALWHARFGGRDLLLLGGSEPDDRWHAFADAVVELTRAFGATEWISLGAIPAAVPHTRAVPILGTESRPGMLRGGVAPGPAGLLKVPAAALSVLEMRVAEDGIPSLGYFAQTPHYVSGPYPVAAVALLQCLERHLGVDLPRGLLAEEARTLRTRLDAATAADETTRAYVARLEAMVDESRLPEGDDLISEIEKFLRERSNGGS